jgi:TniQ
MSTAREPDWIRPTLRALPVTVVPAHRETLDSYLARLAAANRLDREALRAHIAGDERRATPITPERLAAASNQTPDLLRRAIPELEPPTPSSPGPRPRRPDLPFGAPRNECRRCAAARGRRRPAAVLAHHHQAVCPRHHRWLGDAYLDGDNGEQPDLAGHCQIIQANIRHRRITRRHGIHPATTAYRDAAWICRRWHDHHDHDRQFLDQLKDFHGPDLNLTITDATIQASRYPQVVALTRLLASPHWQAKTTPTEPVEFIAEIRRTVAPDYNWTLASPNRWIDPLVQTLGHHLRPPGEEISATS